MKRKSTIELISGTAIAPGLLLQALTITAVTFHHDLTSSFSERKRKFAVYTIRIHHSRIVGPRTVDHRFSAFRTLHNNLKTLVKTSLQHKQLLKGIKFPTKFTIQSSTSRRIVNARRIKLELYLCTVLSRISTNRTIAQSDPASLLLSEFLLLRSIASSRISKVTNVRAASLAFSPQTATGITSNEKWKNPLDSTQSINKKFIQLTGQSVTELLNDELLKVVQNDSRKNGITSQIKAFVNQVKQEYGQGSTRDDVAKILKRSRLPKSKNSTLKSESKSESKSRKQQSFRTLSFRSSERSTLSISDSKALDKAILLQEKKAKRRAKQKGTTTKTITVEEMITLIEAKVYESRLQRVCHFAENLYDLLLSDHLDRLMFLLPLTDELQEKKKKDIQKQQEKQNKWVALNTQDIELNEKDMDSEKEKNKEKETDEDLYDEMEEEEEEEEPIDPREELVKHIVCDAVENAIYSPLFDILKYYSTKLENTTELEMSIIGNISDLNKLYNTSTQNELPQSAFHLNFYSKSNWKDAIHKMQQIEDSKSPTHMLIVLLSAVHSIHNTYYIEAKEQLLNTPGKEKLEPDPLGADDFLPIFVYVTASANLSNPQTAFQMIAHLSNRDRLEGLAKYFLTVFESALWFLAHNDFVQEHKASQFDLHGEMTEDVEGIEEIENDDKEGKEKEETVSRDAQNNDPVTDDKTDANEKISYSLIKLEKRLKLMTGRLKALERMFQFNGITLSSMNRRGSVIYRNSIILSELTVSRTNRTMSSEVEEASLLTNLDMNEK